MVNPSDASEHEESQDEVEEEEEIIQAGFDPLLFWDQYKQFILIGCGVILLGLIGFGVYEVNSMHKTDAAAAALASASNEEDYRRVMDQYPGTVAGGNASLLLAGALRDEQKYDDAIQVLQTFVEKYPTHPMVSAGALAIGENLESEGKLDDALAKYEEVATKYQDSFAAPMALMAEAELYKSQGKIADARRLYENFVAQFPDSVLNQQAMRDMRLLREPAATTGSGASSSGTTTMDINNLLNGAGAAGPQH